MLIEALKQILPRPEFSIFGFQFGTAPFSALCMGLLLVSVLITFGFAIVLDRLSHDWMYPANAWFGRIIFFVCLYNDIYIGCGCSLMMPLLLVQANQSFSGQFLLSWVGALIWLLFAMPGMEKAHTSEADMYSWFILIWFCLYHIPTVRNFFRREEVAHD